jgi:hypothetical protein
MKKSNGKKAHIPAAIPPAPAASNAAVVQPLTEPTLIALTESDRQSINDVNAQLNQLKISLANVDLQRDQLDKTRAEIIAAITKKDAELQNAAKVIARSHGIDPETKKWQIDLSRMALIHL